LELHARERADNVASRSEFLNNEIRLQKEQMNRWRKSNRRIKRKLDEKQQQCSNLRAGVVHDEREAESLNESIAELEATLNEEVLLAAQEKRLQDELHRQQHYREQWDAETSDAAGLLHEVQLECSNLASRLELITDELKRREEKVQSLRANLNGMS
jgi:chromosome segregation ATPase